MFAFMLFFLGLAACVFGGLICFAVSKSMKGTPVSQLSPEDKIAWTQIKTVMMDLYSRYETKETPQQKSLRSWAGTLVICAGLCLIGVVLEAEYDQSISARNVLNGLLGRPCPSSCLTAPAAPPAHGHPADKPSPRPTVPPAK